MKNIFFLLLFSINAFAQSDRIVTNWNFVNTGSVAVVSANNGAFSFTLSADANTSAAVFQYDTIFVKNLWHNRTLSAGNYTEYWNGTDDNGNVISSPGATYQVKIITHNIQAEWQGTLGNSSDNMTGDTKHRGGYHCMQSLCFIGSYGHYSIGYGEGNAVINKFNTSTPNQKIVGTIHGDVNYSCTDGTTIYWAGLNSTTPAISYLFATNAAGAEVTFSSGSPYLHVSSAFGIVNEVNSFITGMGVQPSGDFLFKSVGAHNRVEVYNKTTGALVQTIPLTNPQAIACDLSNNVWIVNNNTVQKFSVGGTGLLSGTLLTLTGTVSPIALGLSADATKISVVDAGASQQVKHYNNSTGSLVSTLGTSGGYFTDATVTNTKFYFSDVNGQGTGQYLKTPFIAYEPDGSYWVSDPGNFRVLKFNSSNTYVTTIISQPASYAVFVDKNNITRVFSDFLEFEIDYSVQTLTGSTGWTLKKNWGANADIATYGTSTPRFETTLSNGRTYGFIRRSNNWEVVEFPATGQLRFTGVILSGLTNILCQDGSLQDYSTVSTNAILKSYPLTGFDGSNNPVWSVTGTTLATLYNDPAGSAAGEFPNSQISFGNKIAFYNPNSKIGTTFFTAPRLGILSKGGTGFNALTEKTTHRTYAGDYPAAGWFELGNVVNEYAGGTVQVSNRNILTSYHGENWKSSQTNKFNLYDTSGVPLLQFGVTGKDFLANTPANAEMAGNVVTTQLVGSGDSLYIYHGDEGQHAAVHRWKVSGLNSLSKQSVTINYASAFIPQSTFYTTLLSGLSYNASLVNSTAGWTRIPTTDNLTGYGSNWWKVYTSHISYDWENDNDMTIEALIPAATTNTVSRSLGANNVATNWKITGNIIWGEDNNVNDSATGRGLFIEVLDASGKLLTKLYMHGSYLNPTHISGNTKRIASGTSANMSLLTAKNQPFEISIAGGTVTFVYGNYAPVTTTISDATANWMTPTTFQIKVVGASGNGLINIVSIQNLKFYKDYL